MRVSKQKKHSGCEKDYNSGLCVCQNSKYLPRFIDESLIICDEVIEETKTISTNFDEKK